MNEKVNEDLNEDVIWNNGRRLVELDVLAQELNKCKNKKMLKANRLEKHSERISLRFWQVPINVNSVVGISTSSVRGLLIKILANPMLL